jgi:glycosyltransferase involved in cell wall biosynthesis
MDQAVDSFIQDNRMMDYLYRSPFRTDVPELLNCIDVYCLPSLWEGLSIALLEAMAMGKAIIATPTDGTKELLTDKENGLVVDFNNQQQLADAILSFFDDQSLFEKCSKNATLLVQQRFNAQRVADSVMEIYAKCVS